MRNHLPLAALLLAGLTPAAATTGGAPMKDPSPTELTLTARGGEDLSLDQYRGQKVLAIFWASW